jgi:hypothetical protein
MGQAATTEDLREMPRIAARMRESAVETENKKYIQMFLRTANMLEERAELVAHQPKILRPLIEDVALHAPVSLLC